MDKIKIIMLNNPCVIKDGTIVNFPYKKVEGLFYYICVNKTISREEAINLLWIDSESALAKKNLRDALYKIRKSLDENIFLTTKKSTISLNTDMVDIDLDLMNKSNIIDIYKGDFLANFTIKNCYEFEEWILSTRQKYKLYFNTTVSKLLYEMINISDYARIRTYSNILIKNDPYNEGLHRDIMKIYALSGNYNLAIKIFNDLTNTLKQDLGIEPELSTKNMYKEIIKLKDSETEELTNANYFYGRFNEIYEVTNTLNGFYHSSGISIVVNGEAGIGKTSFLRKIESYVDTNKFIMLSSNCYNAEKEFYLKSWQNIFSSLSDTVKSLKIGISSSTEQIINGIFPNFSTASQSATQNIDTTRYELASKVIIDLFLNISRHKKIVLVFDDIQWMDNMSKELLKNILYRMGNQNVLVICSYRDDYEKHLSNFLVPLYSKELLKQITLKRFTQEEVKEIAVHQVPTLLSDSSVLPQIYNDTEGNALFLTELLKTIKEKGYTKELSTKATNIIKSRIIDLSDDEKYILNAISIFFDKADVESLMQMVSFDELKIYEIVESLVQKHLLNEIITENNIAYSFTHQKIREYVYHSQTLGKRKLLHKKIADYLEKKYLETNDTSLFSKIIYHFNLSDDKYNTLKYKIEYMKEYYTIYHETFPITTYNINPDNYYKLDNSEQSLIELLNEITISSINLDKKFLALKMEITFILGRLYISKGEYEKGLENIGYSTEISILIDDKKYIIENYKQIIFYCIQVNNLTMMRSYLEKAEELLDTKNVNEDVGTIYRLYGLYYIKIKDYNNASKFLSQAIEVFHKLCLFNNKYTLSLSACYNYLGQMNKYLQNYKIAYDYFIKAIDICDKNNITNGLGIFYSNAGQALYYLGNIDEAYNYINKSITYFEKNDALWGLDIAKCYQTIIEYKLGEKEQADKHFIEANELGNKLKNPATLNLIKEIKEYM